MDFNEFEINSKFSRAVLAQKILATENFDEVYHFIKVNDNKIGNRVAWTLVKVCEHNNEWLPMYFDDILTWLPSFKSQGIQRSILKIVAENDVLPPNKESKWIDLCYHFLNGIDIDVTVKVFSMELLYKFCLKYPDLINEFKLVLDEGCKIYSKAYTARAKKIYKKLGVQGN